MSDGTLFLVGTPIGNLGDASPRSLETLRSVSAIYAEDTRRTAVLVGRFGISTPLRSLHEHNEAARVAEVLDQLRQGESCALVSDAGTPTISDPGRHLVSAVLAAGLRVASVPGPSAVTSAVAISGLPGEAFAFFGFAPRKGRLRTVWMDRVLRSPVTTVVFESPRRLTGLLAEWVDRGQGARKCVVCRELTKLHEEVCRGTVASLSDYYTDREVRGEVTVVIAGQEVAGPSTDREEAQRVAEEMVRAGHSTRDVARRLQEDLGLPRNEAYEMALAAEGSE